MASVICETPPHNWWQFAFDTSAVSFSQTSAIPARPGLTVRLVSVVITTTGAANANRTITWAYHGGGFFQWRVSGPNATFTELIEPTGGVGSVAVDISMANNVAGQRVSALFLGTYERVA